MASRSDKPNFVRRLISCAARWWYCLSGYCLQCGGERGGRWMPIRGEHGRFRGVRFAFGSVTYSDASSGAAGSVSIADNFGEKSILADGGEVLRLVSAGHGRASLVHPDGRIERLRNNRYGTEVYRHGVVSYFHRKRIGGADLAVRSSGHLVIDGVARDLLSPAPWSARLPDGSTIYYQPFNQLVIHGPGQPRTFVWAAHEQRLLEVDFHRQEISFVWATSESESPTPLLDGIITVHPEGGAVQVMHHSIFIRFEAIDWHGPNGLRITRDGGSDRLCVYQNNTVIGIADFVVGGGYDEKSDRTYNRWRFSPGNPVREPRGTGWYSPATTAAILSVSLVVAASLVVGDLVAYAIAVPVMIGMAAILIKKQFRVGMGYVIPH